MSVATWSDHAVGHWIGTVLVTALVLGGMGCEKSPQQKMLEVKQTIASDGDMKSAEKNLKSVLEQEPDNIEAQRLLGEVYAKQGNYEKAETQLNEIWDENNFDDENANLSTRMRSKKGLIQTQFVDLYESWAKEIDKEENPDKFVETVRKGLDYDDTNMDLNELLVDFYWNKGQRLVEEGKKKEAAEAFENILDLRTTRGDSRRQDAEKKARDLRLQFFKEEGKKRFDEEVKPMLGEMDGFELSDDGKTIQINYTHDVDRRLNPNNEKHATQAKQIAVIGLVDKLRRITLGIAGLPEETDLNKIGTSRAKQIFLGSDELKIKGDSIDVRRGAVDIETKLSVDAAIGMAYDVKAAYEEAQQQAKQESGSADAGNGDASGSSADAGSE